MTSVPFDLICTGCGATYDPPRLHCDRCDALLRSRHASVTFDPHDRPDLFAFQDWIPPSKACQIPIGSSVYRSVGLADALGLSNLAIAFSGYAPSIGAANPTGSFKDFEAIPTMLYYREHGIDALILASAGNTARAFAYAAIQLDYPVIIVVPERAVPQLSIPCPPTDAVCLIALEACDDYATAIREAARIGTVLGVANEGGARNVARRDGMSTAILEYARTLNALPDHYVQAIGSGTGAIATWEATQRLLDAGLGDHLPTLHLSQNAPFTPIHDAWSKGTPIRPDDHVEEQLERIERIDAHVLANRTPPYDVPGGVRDALTATNGRTYAISNAEAREAADLFLRSEGLPIGPAASVAAASLRHAVRTGAIASSDAVMLHITGNSDLLLKQDFQMHPIVPRWIVRPEALTDELILTSREKLLPLL